MYELEIPDGVEVKAEARSISVKGKLGSTSKTINTRLFTVKAEGKKIAIEPVKNKKLEKIANLAAMAFSNNVKAAMDGVENGIERKMKVVFAHFPMTIEIKGDKMLVKNIFGEKVARSTSIVGSTKVEVKGQDVTVRGVDPYDVGQTVANIRKMCYARGYDTRVFQDGIYQVVER